MKITGLNFDVFCRNVLLKEIVLVNFPPKILLRGKFTRDRGCPKIGVHTTYLPTTLSRMFKCT
jgi:hypothetical protein